MKQLSILACLLAISIASVQVQAAEGFLITYDGENHRISRRIGKQADANERYVSRVHPIVQMSAAASEQPGRMSVRLVHANGRVQQVGLADPRIIRAPLGARGEGHEAILVREKGTYILPVDDPSSITQFTISLPDINDPRYRRLSQ